MQARFPGSLVPCANRIIWFYIRLFAIHNRRDNSAVATLIKLHRNISVFNLRRRYMHLGCEVLSNGKSDKYVVFIVNFLFISDNSCIGGVVISL